MIFCSTALLSAQEIVGDEVYTKTKLISKIYIHKDGYKILYQKSDMSFGTFYIPMSWFSGGNPKAELVLGKDTAYPYFSIFWVDGVFHHIRIYAQKLLTHITWGSLDLRYDFTADFNVTDVDIEF